MRTNDASTLPPPSPPDSLRAGCRAQYQHHKKVQKDEHGQDSQGLYQHNREVSKFKLTSKL